MLSQTYVEGLLFVKLPIQKAPAVYTLYINTLPVQEGTRWESAARMPH